MNCIYNTFSFSAVRCKNPMVWKNIGDKIINFKMNTNFSTVYFMGEKTKNLYFIHFRSNRVNLILDWILFWHVFSNMVNEECINIIYDFIILFFYHFRQVAIHTYRLNITSFKTVEISSTKLLPYEHLNVNALSYIICNIWNLSTILDGSNKIIK